MWHTDLVAPRHVGSSRTRARTHVPCIGRQILNHCGMWILNHCTTREVPSAHFLIELFGFLILSYISCLYILEINPLSIASFANTFSHSEGCLFVLFIVSFAVQNLFSLIRSHLFIFAFISITLGDRFKKILLWFMSKSVLLMFSSRSFIVSSLTYRF